MTLLKPIEEVPANMAEWEMRYERHNLTFDNEGEKVGKYAVVSIKKSPIEQQHIVRVIDENEQDMTGVRVIFGFPGGNGQAINIGGRNNLWNPPDAPALLRGNAVHTLVGIATHTVGEGGEDIWIHNVEESGSIELASDIVRNCTWRVDINRHTCVMITFQRQDRRVKINADRIKELEDRVKTLEETVVT